MRRFKKKKAKALLAAALLVVCLPTAAWGEELTPEASAEATDIAADTPTPEPPAQAEATPEPEMPTEPTEEPAASTDPAASAEPTQIPDGAATPEPTPTATAEPESPDGAQTPAPTPDVSETPEPTATPEPTPTPTPTPEPEETFTPTGEAWTKLSSGEYLDGSLIDVMRAVQSGAGPGPVYVRVMGSFSLPGITESTVNTVPIVADQKALPGCQVVFLANEAGYTAYVTGGMDDSVMALGFDEPVPLEEPEEPKEITVKCEGTEGEWTNEPPVFLLSSNPEVDNDTYIFAVYLDGQSLIKLKGRSSYVPPEGKHTLRFTILSNSGGDVPCLPEPAEKNFTAMWDITPPDMLEIEGTSDTQCVIHASDALSGVDSISLDGGKTWQFFNEKDGYTINGTTESVLWPGSIVVRDRAGNMTAYTEWYEFSTGGEETAAKSGGGGGTVVSHARETSDYSLANYNALDLEFSSEPSEELVAGGTVLPVSLTSEVGDQTAAGLFTAHLESWRVDEEDERTTPNALVLTASGQSDLNTWSFSGEAYRLLYNSGIDYLVFESDGYITAVSTAGFTAGTTYARLKAGGTSTKKFFYTINQDESLRETTLCVEVEGMTYLLGEERDQPMYRYDVLIGSADMMGKPFRSYLPEDGGSGEAVRTYPLVLPQAQGSAETQPGAQAADGEEHLPDALIFG